MKSRFAGTSTTTSWVEWVSLVALVVTVVFVPDDYHHQNHCYVCHAFLQPLRFETVKTRLAKVLNPKTRLTHKHNAPPPPPPLDGLFFRQDELGLMDAAGLIAGRNSRYQSRNQQQPQTQRRVLVTNKLRRRKREGQQQLANDFFVAKKRPDPLVHVIYNNFHGHDDANHQTITSSPAVLLSTKDVRDSTAKSSNQEKNQFNKDSNSNNTVSAPLCWVVTLSDGKIPTSRACLPESLFEEPQILHKLDNIYHAMSHQETKMLQYMEKDYKQPLIKAANDDNDSDEDEEEERKLISVIRTSLEDAGFQLLTRRDLDLCDALNAGYLLRLSIVPDTSDLDTGIMNEFYPERFVSNSNHTQPQQLQDLLFEGKVLVFWRGYSQEVSRGRLLLLPKLDYLQASLVQRAAAWLKKRLDLAERTVATQVNGGMRNFKAATLEGARVMADGLPDKRLARAVRTSLRASVLDLQDEKSRQRLDRCNDDATRGDGQGSGSASAFFKLSRYGGSKTRFVGSPNPKDALNPFVICETNNDCNLDQVDEFVYECLNHKNLKCPYDEKSQANGEQLPPMQLLERVTMSNLVDPFSREGRKSFFKSFFSSSELVEPTYEEVVVIWRNKEDEHERVARPVWTLPRIVYELADMFDYDDILPVMEDPNKRKEKMPLQIRTFDKVPMANLPAVMPKTKLVFRPADAFVFDLVSVVSLLLVCGSIRFDSARLDLLALGSVSLWIIRLIIRYSNKLARYDLLVKKFLTSKISHRNAGALKYLVAEAGEQRAARAGLVHTWLCQQKDAVLDRAMVLKQGMMDVNDLVKGKQVHVDISAALNDLEDIGFITCVGDKVMVTREHASIVDRIKQAWNNVLEGRMTMQKLVGRRDRR